jgi:hypothetical protein
MKEQMSLIDDAEIVAVCAALIWSALFILKVVFRLPI